MGGHMGARSPRVELRDEAVIARGPEGQEARTTVGALVDRIRERGMSTEGVILPRGVVHVVSEGPLTAWVHETPPRIHPLQWIAADSPARYGNGTTYRNVRLALPYLVTIAVFARDRRGLWTITNKSEAFFSLRPIRSPADPLLYPALLNCSRFEPQEGSPLSWICSTTLDRSGLKGLTDPNARMREGFRALMHCLLESGFNYSSEEHEASSWFTDSGRRDPRIATVERWEEESLKDSRFVFDVPWIETGKTVDEVARRSLSLGAGERPSLGSERDLAREVFALARGSKEGPAGPAGGLPLGGLLFEDLPLPHTNLLADLEEHEIGGIL